MVHVGHAYADINQKLHHASTGKYVSRSEISGGHVTIDHKHKNHHHHGVPAHITGASAFLAAAAVGKAAGKAAESTETAFLRKQMMEHEKAMQKAANDHEYKMAEKRYEEAEKLYKASIEQDKVKNEREVEKEQREREDKNKERDREYAKEEEEALRRREKEQAMLERANAKAGLQGHGLVMGGHTVHNERDFKHFEHFMDKAEKLYKEEEHTKKIPEHVFEHWIKIYDEHNPGHHKNFAKHLGIKGLEKGGSMSKGKGFTEVKMKKLKHKIMGCD